MKVLILLLLVIAQGASVDAPADQYFGRMKMSGLRIRYELMQLKPRYEKHQLLPEEAAHLVELDEDAFYAWAAAYPKDSWLASSGYLLAQLYAELPGSDARARAVRAYTYVKTHFPTTSYGKESIAALHRGVPVRPDPAWAVAMRAARATPTPSPSPSALPSPSIMPSPAPSTAPSGSAAPSPSPAPSPARGRVASGVRIAEAECTTSSPSAETRFRRGRLPLFSATS
jgi:hypothetical protein